MAYATLYTMVKMSSIDTLLPYPLYLGEGLLVSSNFLSLCQKFDRCFLFCDTTVYALHGHQIEAQLRAGGIRLDVLVIPPGEGQKTRAQKSELEDELLDRGCTRRSVLLALGGGVMMDLIGFVGATFHRGIAVVYLPTTLLGMVDAAIGGKTGVNTARGKNLIGCFAQPHSVWIDPLVLETLPAREIRSGWGEVAKHALLGDPILWAHLQGGRRKTLQWSEILASSCRFKASIVVQDEKEQGLRAILNLGHTVGHALEQACGYTMSHGACVAMGLWVEARVGAQCAIQSPLLYQGIGAWVQSVFPEEIIQAQQISWAQLHPFLQQDKKGRLQAAYPLVLIQEIGVPWKGFEGWIFWASVEEVETAWAQFCDEKGQTYDNDNTKYLDCQRSEPRSLGT